ncbi:hypothetical protein [Nocardioides flavescens]|uniref:Uncharacterized protein n=1 Tax=Nocardioides flavescens TaxID=2691959 RepID=A0A6L7F061_9ACTN|nr:hypothetical protein [Nocardioides flavescens]MXG90139.1 hypothetical protein [Nocardioides flavescens]
MSEHHPTGADLERREPAPAPAVPSVPPRRTVPEPAPRSFSLAFGWTLVAVATGLLAFASWDLYPDDGPGMWAGYRDSLLVLVIAFSLALLRVNVPKTPFIGACGIVGVLLVLEGIFLASTLRISIPEIMAGVVIVLGSVLMASAPDR